MLGYIAGGCMISLLHHDTLADHLTSATGVLVVTLIVAVVLEVLAYVRR
jgi:hypothetical protein